MADYTIEKQLFALLDKQRHLPKYNLELRTSPFFELFLPKILGESGMPVKTPIIPEFPLKKNNDQSNNVDFFALSKDSNSAFLIELKMDTRARRSSQDAYLKKAKRESLVALICGIKQIGRYSRSYRKYVHLLKQLADLELVDSVSEAVDKAFSDNPRGVREAIWNVKVTAPECCPKMVYIQPTQSNSTSEDCITITFEQVATVVAKHGTLGKVFAEYLTKWQYPPAKHAP